MRSSRLRNLPLALRGSWVSRNQIVAGILCLAMRPSRNARSPSASSSAPVAQHDHRADVLAQPLVGDAEHGDLGHGVVLVDRHLDLRAVHVLAAPQHHVLGPVDDEHEAVGVDAGDVAGVEPAVADALGRGVGAVQVALDDDRAAHAELADGVGTGGQHGAVVGDELGVERRHDRAARRRLGDEVAGAVGGDDAVGLGQAVAGRRRRRPPATGRSSRRGRAAAGRRRRRATAARSGRASTSPGATAARGSSSARRRSS